ncbi:carboxymuconolactone decarboxylase family protein [Dickeya dianthicola]|uniref:carboxymuconolactone decarboxylase family protein n=1 Tax=Dickeya dianthicola TaxID=204039 RepID=UPI00136DD65A|nr:carboxymuconolactone decarboxylase family protein [Dickeya dianthicola]MCI4237473.1 carboxymuconolactone decarboxylase family protein [Dickeya dianthicola]MCI4255907.1 carboxymuconolactone decarboxylase family protein [Dickeya dianthicola]MZG24252.1 carboxymuconolactone decarboxylase family protein [Dickeya dianthicola]MZI87937.1 carboxymuconolactone decarboxylase family protein [Dickeya dianthicola]
MFLNWNEYRGNLLATIGKFAKLQPEFMKGFQLMDKGASENKHLDPKIHELIALAVAVTTRCDGCLTVHIDAAVKHGATRDEIAEALAVAVNLNAGAALTYSARALDAFDNLPTK